MQEKNSLCGSKNYPYLGLLHGRDFSLNPHLSGNSSQASYIYLNLWGFESPPPPGISNPFHGRSMDIFWNYTLKEQHTQDNAIAKETLMLDHTHAKQSSCNTWAQWNPSTPEVPLTTTEDMLLSVDSI